MLGVLEDEERVVAAPARVLRVRTLVEVGLLPVRADFLENLAGLDFEVGFEELARALFDEVVEEDEDLENDDRGFGGFGDEIVEDEEDLFALVVLLPALEEDHADVFVLEGVLGLYDGRDDPALRLRREARVVFFEFVEEVGLDLDLVLALEVLGVDAARDGVEVGVPGADEVEYLRAGDSLFRVYIEELTEEFEEVFGEGVGFG